MKISLFLSILIMILVSCKTGHKTSVEDLRCEYMTDPMGIDVTHPRFSWIMTSDRRGVYQKAYRITVYTSGKKNRVWDSGKIISRKTMNITYQGTPLQSGKKYTWQVEVWDDEDVKSTSEEAVFLTGLLNPSDWKAKWIMANDTAISAPLLRKEFSINKKIQHAYAYVTGLGNYELYLNGKKTGDHVLDPARTDFRKRVLYATYDVTDLLKQGNNAAGLIAGNGTYRMVTVKGRYGWSGDKPRNNTPRVLLQIDITYTDGSKEGIVTDSSWKSLQGPITFNHVYGGEDYDARLEQPGWATADFNDSGWQAAKITEAPHVIMKSQTMPPIKMISTIEPVAETHPTKGVTVYDMGQNFAGWWRIKVKGQKGTTLHIKGAETLNDSLFPAPLKTGDRISTNHRYHSQVWTDYTLKGEGIETWEPRFFYTGYRYLEVTTNDPDNIISLQIEGRVVHTALETSGSFESSDTLLNRIWKAALWSQRGNLHGVPTDCPHREKGAYNGDGEVIAETSIHEFNMAAFYTKWLNDMLDSQEANGRIPNTSPTLIGGYGGGIPWGSAYILIPWWMYQYYTDTTAIAIHYETMKKYLAYLHNLARNDSNPDEPYIINDFGSYWYSLGEWCAPGKPDGPNHPVISTAYYYLDALTLSKMADILGNTNDADRFAALADSVKQAFNSKFFNPETGLYGSDSLYQTYQVVALAFDLVPEEYQNKVLKDLTDDIMTKRNGHLYTGIIGTKYLWQILSKNGYQDVAYTILKQTTYPGYGYWITNGATTLWEQWDAKNSHNHQMFGTVSEFFYRYLAGINAPTDDETSTGYEHIYISPYIPDDLKYVKASIKTIHGKVVSHWKQQDGKLFLHVEIPANCNAGVNIPVKGLKNISIKEDSNMVWENNSFVKGTRGVINASKDQDHILLSIVSGSYNFTIEENAAKN